MVKKIFAHAIVGGLIALVGALLHDFARMRDLGTTLAVAGLGYAAISLSMLLVPLYKKIKPQIETAIDEKSRTKAYEELLRLKKLLDEKIISQQEFDTRSRLLKAKVL